MPVCTSRRASWLGWVGPRPASIMRTTIAGFAGIPASRSLRAGSLDRRGRIFRRITGGRCAGRRVVPVVNLKALGPQEREAWERQEREEAAYRQVERMELMLGC